MAGEILKKDSRLSSAKDRPCFPREGEWRLATWCWGALLLAPLLVLCVRHLDVPLALLVQRVLDKTYTSHMPDLLPVLVVVTAFLSSAVYLVRKRQGRNDPLNLLLKLVSWLAPVSFLTKMVLKYLFGRVNTRLWLEHPSAYGFHWLNGGQGFEGFPSGHMLVVVALLAAPWRFYPRLRVYCAGGMLLLGGALVATNYHFLSDVLSGAYLALGVEAAVFRLGGRHHGE